MNQYREEVRSADREFSFTLWKAFKWGLGIMVVLVVLGWIAQSAGIISMDIEREKIQHSQQYVETKVALLNKLHNDYMTLNTEIAELSSGTKGGEIVAAKRAQQKSTLKRLRNEANLIPSSQVPDHIQSFLAIHSQR